MATIIAVLRSCMESFKSILTSQEFGSEYELLCTELSTQWLRIRLWGELVGLRINDAGHLQNSVFQRPDIESTITQCVESIAYLLTEIDVLRRKYELRTPLNSAIKQVEKSIRACKSMSTLSDFRRPASSIRQKMKDNNKQTSFLSMTKWALCDAKRFDEKVKRLKGLVDGLEDISQAAGITRTRSSRRRRTREENPPPYSVSPPPTQDRPIEPVTLDPGILAHHVALKRFIGLHTRGTSSPRSTRARPKLMSLSNTQLKELRMDVYDELLRRQSLSTPLSPCLINNPSYHPKRNEAREKLSTLSIHRFKDLTTDVVGELERRYTALQMHAIDELERVVQVPDVSTTSRGEDDGRRYERVQSPAPPPRLEERVSHPASSSTSFGPSRTPTPTPILARALTVRVVEVPKPRKQVLSTSPPSSSPPHTRSTHLSRPPVPARSPSSLPDPSSSTTTKTTTITLPPSSSNSSRGSVEIFKSLHVSMTDPAYKVLPAVLKRYNINAPWENYTLYIVCGDVERCLALDEMPLMLFKRLDREGKKPMFMLRKIACGPLAAQLASEKSIAGGII